MRCGAVWEADGTTIEPVEELYAPNSPAAFFSRVTELLGFRPGAEEHKVQWMSVRGKPRFRDAVLEILGDRGDGLPQLDHSYFDTSRTTAGSFSEKFYSGVGMEYGVELSGDERTDLAASLQSAIEEIVIRMAGEGENLCLGGGLMLNAMLVAAIENSGRFANVWVQPVAGNGGTSLGCALHAWHQVFRKDTRQPLGNLFLGPDYDRDQIKQVLENCKLRFRYLMTDDEVIQTAVERLGDHQIVAWFQGRMEFGSLALGNRSIFASPLNPYSTENLNVYIKRREPDRKFAASVPRRDCVRILRLRRHGALPSYGQPRPRSPPKDLRSGSDRPRRHPRSHRAQRGQSALLAAPARGRQGQRPPGALQHLVQSIRRALGVRPPSRRPQLLLLGHRRPVRRQLPAGEVRGLRVSVRRRVALTAAVLGRMGSDGVAAVQVTELC